LLASWIVFAAGAADAADLTGECLWNALPAAAQDRIYAGYSERGYSAVLDDKTNPTDSGLAACAGWPTDQSKASKLGVLAAHIFIPTKLEFASREYLVRQGYARDRLESAWSDLTPEKRVQLRNLGKAMLTGGKLDFDPAAEVVLDAAETAGWEAVGTPAAMREAQSFGDFFIGRAAREHFEAEAP